MNKITLSILLFVTILLTACTQRVSLSEPIEEPPLPNHTQNRSNLSNSQNLSNPCTGVVCESDKICVNGVCSCEPNKKNCNNLCINKKDCCTNLDCNQNENCISGTCVFSCKSVICPSNKVCEEDFKGCTCPSKYRFCNLQNKCIPNDHCCTAFDCGRGSENRCSATVTSSEICLFSSNKKSCKYYDEGRSKTVETDNKIYDVLVMKYNYTTNAQVAVGNNIYSITPGNKKEVDKEIGMILSPIKETGGDCNKRDVVSFNEPTNLTN